MIQKSYSKQQLGTLYLVPTPIGNIEDITLRALNILKEVFFIYAEDTREAKKLLIKYNIENNLNACHKFNESKVKEEILSNLQNGKNIALISDRGTPLISDPGFLITKYCIENNVNVVALPGPSALLPALNMSGIESNHFLFYGFLNNKDSQSLKELTSLADLPFTIILYESPHRLSKTLQNILKIMGNRTISISREISKLYEEVFRGLVTEAIKQYENTKGEIVIIIEQSDEVINESEPIKEVKELQKYGMSTKDSINFVSKKYNISKNLLYNKAGRKEI